MQPQATPFTSAMLLRRAVPRNCRLLRVALMSTHVERTQDSTRSELVSDVVVTEVKQISPSVKGFRLKASNRQLAFKPGQWVDLSIPSEHVVGGYSITSTPHQLAEDSELRLAVLHSEHPPALWMNTRCRVGDKLSVRVGGDFYYAPTTPTNLLLIAGGVGINPLFSMLQHHHSLVQSENSTSAGHQCHHTAHLLYSAKNVRELLFKDEIDVLSESSCHISVKYFVTQERPSTGNIPFRRMAPEDISAAVHSQGGSSPHCFVCGPPPMTEDILTALRHLGIEHIHYEKWW